MKTKQLLFYISLIVIILLFCISCSKAPQVEDKGIYEKILKKKVIRVGTDFVGTPFAFIKDGKETGFEVDLMQALVKKLNLEIEWVKIPFGINNFIKALNKNEVDVVIESISRTQDRADKLEFSNSYFISGQAVILRKDENVPDRFDLTMLNNKKIGVEKGTTGALFTKNNTSATIIEEFDSSIDQINALINGDVYAIISDILNTQTTDWPYWKKIKVVLKNLTQEEYCFAAKKGETYLIKKLNELLRQSKDDPIDGVYAKLYRKWFY